MKTLVRKDLVKQVPDSLAAELPRLEKHLKVIVSGTATAVRKGRDLVPEADFALAVKEPLALPDAPLGYLLLTYKGLGLGFVKNLGGRTNSLLPNARRIRKNITL